MKKRKGSLSDRLAKQKQIESEEQDVKSEETEGSISEQSIPAVDAILGRQDTSRLKKVPVREIDTKRCRAWEFHNRSDAWLTEEKLKSLVESIQKDGQQQYGLVREIPSANKSEFDYEIIFGYRRWAACKALGVRYLARVLPDDYSDQDCARLTSAENEESEDISELEKALWYRRQLKEGLFNEQKELAEAFGISAGYVSRLVSAAAIVEYPWLIDILNPVIIDVSVRNADTISKLLKDRNPRERIRRAADTIAESELQLSAKDIIKKLLDAGEEKSAKPKTLVIAKKGKKPIVSVSEDIKGGYSIKIDRELKGRADVNETLEKLFSKLKSDLS